MITGKVVHSPAEVWRLCHQPILRLTHNRNLSLQPHHQQWTAEDNQHKVDENLLKK